MPLHLPNLARPPTLCRWQIPAHAKSGVYFAKLIRYDGKGYWRADASPLAPSPKFADPAIDPDVAPPCKDGSFKCQAIQHVLI